MQYIDDSEVEIFVNIVTSMSHNKVQLFLGNHVVESDVSRFVRENYLVAMGCLGAGSKQICKLLPMMLIHIDMRYAKYRHEVCNTNCVQWFYTWNDVRYKGNKVCRRTYANGPYGLG